MITKNMELYESLFFYASHPSTPILCHPPSLSSFLHPLPSAELLSEKPVSYRKN